MTFYLVQNHMKVRLVPILYLPIYIFLTSLGGFIYINYIIVYMEVGRSLAYKYYICLKLSLFYNIIQTIIQYNKRTSKFNIYES
jgi:hypothetical protein